VLYRCADPGEANVTKLATKFNSQAATIQRVRINPVQFHFHTRSEHVLDGERQLQQGHISMPDLIFFYLSAYQQQCWSTTVTGLQQCAAL
jgi:hypothetical protein